MLESADREPWSRPIWPIRERARALSLFSCTPARSSWAGRADAGYRNEWKFKSAKPKQVSQVPSQARGQASGEHSFRERKQQTTSAMFARQVSRKHPEEQEEEQVEEQALTREQKEEDARLAHVM